MAHGHSAAATKLSAMKNLSIITGFLGSGKTTLLNRLLRDPQMEATAVLINELGDVGIDHLIVDEFDDDIVLLESGCVCCSVRDDLTASLLNLHDRGARGEIPEFKQAVLETTGIADPASILQVLMADEDVCSRYGIGSVITVADAVFGAENLDAIPEASAQVLMADWLVVSKTDLASGEQERRLRRKLREISATAPFLQSADATPEQLFSASASDIPRPEMAPAKHKERFQTFQLAWDDAVEWSAIENWIEGLLSARGDDIFRIKGILSIEGESQPTVFQSVQHSVYAPTRLTEWPGGKPHSDLTFITQHFSRTAALASLRPFLQVTVRE